MENDISITEFIKNIDDAYQWADLVISRSGALTVSELIASRSAAILVPLKTSIDDHQKENANYLISNNAAWILEETDSFSVELKSLLVSILKNRESLLQKKQSISQIEIKDSETIIFNEVNAWYQ
jgi:UDP-N-acetylglucosamine--N-acetylmuramyl-(pentapeptide) pyrophosphoryl-undecaprenol N-acetylglucosamine transferase